LWQVLKATGNEDPKFPHPFELSIKVQLGDNSLTQEMAVTNTGKCAKALSRFRCCERL
jgi:galactose mutarotase-like enzyme